ncbi:MAG: metallophosphoesterase [Candidatus Moraniibacteriota bacterium]
MKKIPLSIFSILAAALVIAGIFMVQSRFHFSEVIEKDGENSVEQPSVPIEDKTRANLPQAPASDDAKFSFAVIGDTQRFKPGNANGGFQQAVKSITAKNVDFLMTEGDLLSSCGEDCAGNLTTWKNILGPLVSKTYELMGNHDRTGRASSDSAWQNMFDLPTNGPDGYSELTYSFNFQNSHFVVLNSEKPKGSIVDKTQRDWLGKDLAANKKENTFVFFHEPAYPVSSKIDASLDAYADERDALWNIFTTYGVTAVFNGHEHIYSRRNIGSIYQFVFGNTDSYDHELPKSGVAEFSYQGKSFGIVEVAGKQITVNLYEVGGKMINSFQFSR